MTTPTMPFSGSVNEAIRHTEEHAEDFGLSQDDVEGYTARMQELQRPLRVPAGKAKIENVLERAPDFLAFLPARALD